MGKLIQELALTNFATAYSDQSVTSELVIPEALDALSKEELASLYTEAVEAFEALHAEAAESGFTADQLAKLTELTEAIEALSAETDAREAAQVELAETAAALAARVHGSEETAEATEVVDTVEAVEEVEPAPVVASASSRPEVRVQFSKVKRTPSVPAPAAPSMSSIVSSTAEGTGYAIGAGMSWDDIGRSIDRKLQGYNHSQYARAAAEGRQMREQHSSFAIKREFDSRATVSSNDRESVEAVLNYAVDQSRLPGGGLLASGGWCAPSETVYDMLEMESRDGMISLPEVGINRGGLHYTQGPSFADIYSNITGFNFTEEEAIAGKFKPGAGGGANVVGDKPFYSLTCPDFIDKRLSVAGLGIQAGLLAARGYPEVIARSVRGALVAHDHRVDSRVISAMQAGSTAVALADQAGAAAPILAAVELQAEHYRYTHRLARGTVLEAVFPYWTRGVIRADLSRRLGVDLISVNDARITEWFRERGVAAQFVYNWQNIAETAAGDFKAWPTEVGFLLYAAGTWVRGSSDVITLDTLYDSTLLGTNDYTALFTEEGYMVVKRGHDSRYVKMKFTANGVTNMGADILATGALAPVTP